MNLSPREKKHFELKSRIDGSFIVGGSAENYEEFLKDCFSYFWSLMEYADLNLSPREQKAFDLAYSMRGIGVTTIEIQEKCNTCAPGADMADLRKKYIPVPPAEYQGKSKAGRKIYRYWLGVK